MDSPENLPAYPSAEPDAISPPTLPRIRIIRDGILASWVRLPLTLALVVAGVVGALITGIMPMPSNSGQGFAPTAGWIVAILFAGELPFASFAMYLRWRYRRKGHPIKTLFGGTSVSAIAIGVGTGIGMAVFGFLHAALAAMIFAKHQRRRWKRSCKRCSP